MKYPRQQWEAQREVITELYSRPDLSLTEIVTIMADEYDFHATEAMYKKHLYRWGAFKNVVAHHRDELVKIALACSRARLCLPEEDEEGRSIPWDRVKRSCLRNGEHVEMWRSLAVPPRKQRTSDNRTKRIRSAHRQRGTRNDSLRDRRRITNAVRRHQSCDTDVLAHNVVRALLRHHPTPIVKEPRSSTHNIDHLLSCIPDFQAWRASTMRKPGSELTTAAATTAAVSANRQILGDTDREDAAMNIINDYIDLIRSVHHGRHLDVRRHFASARRHFENYLKQPSLFALYAILMVHACTSCEDREVHAWKTRLLNCFYVSSRAELGSSNPLTELLRQSLADDATTWMRWKIAILACLVDTAATAFDSAPEAAKWTTLTIRHGLALTLYARGYPASAILCLQDTIEACATFQHPQLRVAPWSRLHLAEIYQTQGMYAEARAVLQAASAEVASALNTTTSAAVGATTNRDPSLSHHHRANNSQQQQQQQQVLAQVPGGRLLCCFTLFGSAQKPLLPTVGYKYVQFQRLYELSCRVHETDGPLTPVYARLCRDLLRGTGAAAPTDTKAQWTLGDNNGEETGTGIGTGTGTGTETGVETARLIRTIAHYGLKESPRRFITFASAGMV